MVKDGPNYILEIKHLIKKKKIQTGFFFLKHKLGHVLTSSRVSIFLYKMAFLRVLQKNSV